MRLSQFRLIDFDNLKFVRGTYKTFGLRCAVSLASPLANLILNWKYRNDHLRL